MKKAAVLIISVIMFLFFPIRANAMYDPSYFYVHSFLITDDAAYIDLMISMDKSDEHYTDYNAENMERFSFDDSLLRDYRDSEGFISFSCHYKNNYTDMEIIRSDSAPVDSYNHFALMKYSDGDIGEDAPTATQMREDHRQLKIAILDKDGNIIQVSDSFYLKNEKGEINNNSVNYYIENNYVKADWRERSDPKLLITVLILVIVSAVIIIRYLIKLLIFIIRKIIRRKTAVNGSNDI